MRSLVCDRLGVVAYSPGHPDLPIYRTSITFLWGHLEHLVYETPINSDKDFIVRIFKAVAHVREMHDILERAQQSLHRRRQACISTVGRNIEQFL
ncbi:uncharacterized protein TNCV_1685861 [Trichonephila clavipes]|nr:uncharacterized protein TNCV_1685861 [Trichonephila clavipes]